MLSHELVSTGRCTMPLVAMVASVLLSTPLPAAQLGPRPNAPLSVEKLSRIDDFLNDQVAQGEIPGAVVLIQRRGKPVYFKWFGKRDVDAGIDMTPDSIFPLHSLTKTVTSFAAMMLAMTANATLKTAAGATAATAAPVPTPAMAGAVHFRTTSSRPRFFDR